MTKRKYMKVTSADHYAEWDKHCVFSVQKHIATDPRCKHEDVIRPNPERQNLLC